MRVVERKLDSELSQSNLKTARVPLHRKPVKHFRTTQAFTQLPCRYYQQTWSHASWGVSSISHTQTFTFRRDLLRKIFISNFWYMWKLLVTSSVLQFIAKMSLYLSIWWAIPWVCVCVCILLLRFNSLVQVILLDPGWLHSRHVSIPKFSHWLDILLPKNFAAWVTRIVCSVALTWQLRPAVEDETEITFMSTFYYSFLACCVYSLLLCPLSFTREVAADANQTVCVPVGQVRYALFCCLYLLLQQ